MARNYVRVGVGVKDDASGPIDRIRDKFEKIQKQGAKGFAIGAGAALTAKGISMVGDALSGVVDFTQDSIEAASNLNEAWTKTEAVFGRNSDELDDWASTAARSFGQSKRQALEAASSFGNLFDSMGLANSASVDMSKGITELASDLASFNNVEVDEALLALRSGLVGETEPMRRFGVAINAAAVEAKALEMGLAGSKKEISEADKVMARYQLILESTTNAQGDFARTAEGMANQQRTLSALAEDTSAKFGEVLLPIVVEFQQTIIKAMDSASISMEELEAAAAKGSWGAQAHLNRLAAKAGDTERDVEKPIGGIQDTFDDMAETAEETTESVGESFEDMAETIEEEARKAAQALIDEFFDPIETRASIYEAQQEQRAAEEARRDAETAKEKREAADDIIAAIDDQADALVDLSEQGAITDKDVDEFEENVKSAYKALGKQVPIELQKIIKKLRELASFEEGGTTVNVKVTGGGGKKKAAMGGPASGQTLVGEQGPEVVDLPPGSFVHHAQSPVTKAALAGGGPAVYNFNLTVQGDIKARDGEEILRTMRRLEAVSKPMGAWHG